MQSPLRVRSTARSADVDPRARAALTTLIGRETEFADIAALMNTTRLLTLTGIGGTGKTRLALEAALRAGERQAVLVVELAPIDSPEHVAVAVRLAIAAADPDHIRPAPGRSALQDAISWLERRKVLLVLDNCEHMVQASAQVVVSLLGGCPQLQVLATSRRPLRVDGETVWPVPPLSLPDERSADQLIAALQSEAGRLFVNRAARSRPGFALTTENAPAVLSICRELEGVPLAIELAAGRARVLSPAQIATGLLDRMRLLAGGPHTSDERLRSMRGSLDWSHALLDEPERMLLRRLAVASEWTLEAVEDICTYGQQERAASLDTLSSLVGQGLVNVIDAGEELRYRMLETVRSYALGHLQSAAEEQDVRARHMHHFCRLAARSEELLETATGRRRLERDTPQLLGALEFAQHDDPQLALQMAADLGPWWLIHESYGQSRDTCSRVLSATPDGQPRARAQVLWAAALLAIHDEDYAQARIHAEEAFPLAQASGDKRTIGRWMVMAGNAQRSIDAEAAAAVGVQAVEILRAEGDAHGLAFALANLALTEGMRDRFHSLREISHEFATLAGEKPPWLAPWVENALAWADISQGHPRSALGHCTRALQAEAERGTLGYYIATAHRLHALALAGEAAEAHQRGLVELDRTRRAGLAIASLAIERSVTIAEFALGDLESAEARARRGCEDPHRYMAAQWRETLMRIALARGEVTAAREHASLLRAFAQSTNSARKLAQADWAEGAAALLDGEPQQAVEPLHRALSTQTQQGLLPEAIDTLQKLGEVALAGEAPSRGARLMGAAQAARQELGVVAIPAHRDGPQALYEVGQQALGNEQHAAAFAEGETMTLERAIDYVRRGRGSRDRPARGWESLSQVQVEVAALAAKGLSNPEIAQRLFISRGTVKAHLTQIYRKLDVNNRTQLAAIARDAPVPTAGLVQ